MKQGKYVFAQLTDFLPQRVFDRLVPLNELLTNQNYQDVKELYHKQLKTSWI